MTEEELKEIKKRLKKVIPIKWLASRGLSVDRVRDNADFMDHACQDVKDLVAEVRMLQEMNRWFPISKPPQDNGYVLVAYGKFLPFVALYQDGGFYTDDDSDNPIVDPSNWRPLPASPKGVDG